MARSPLSVACTFYKVEPTTSTRPRLGMLTGPAWLRPCAVYVAPLRGRLWIF